MLAGPAGQVHEDITSRFHQVDQAGDGFTSHPAHEILAPLRITHGVEASLHETREGPVPESHLPLRFEEPFQVHFISLLKLAPLEVRAALVHPSTTPILESAMRHDQEPSCPRKHHPLEVIAEEGAHIRRHTSRGKHFGSLVGVEDKGQGEASLPSAPLLDHHRVLSLGTNQVQGLTFSEQHSQLNPKTSALRTYPTPPSWRSYGPDFECHLQSTRGHSTARACSLGTHGRTFATDPLVPSFGPHGALLLFL